MKTLILENDGYKLYVETEEYINRGTDNMILRFTSTFDGAKDPNAHWTKFQMILTQEQRNLLISILSNSM